VALTINGDRLLGKMCLKMIVGARTPVILAARMKSCSRSRQHHRAHQAGGNPDAYHADGNDGMNKPVPRMAHMAMASSMEGKAS